MGCSCPPPPPPVCCLLVPFLVFLNHRKFLERRHSSRRGVRVQGGRPEEVQRAEGILNPSIDGVAADADAEPPRLFVFSFLFSAPPWHHWGTRVLHDSNSACWILPRGMISLQMISWRQFDIVLCWLPRRCAALRWTLLRRT